MRQQRHAVMKRRPIITFILTLAFHIFSFGQRESAEPSPIELREFVYESNRLKALHVLAYVREYSTISTYTDTVAMFREKLVDYMIAPRKKSRFNGWRTPRVLSSRSYYRFTDDRGLDSVSNRYNQHFSWSDWIGLPPPVELPARLRAAEYAGDTVRGKYSAAEIWNLTHDTLSVRVDVLADTAGRKWVPSMSRFFDEIYSFDEFKLAFRYYNTGEQMLNPVALTDFSYSIESQGRGRGIYLFSRADQPFFVSTSSEVYIIDKEYVTLKEAKKWEKLKIDSSLIGIYEPSEAPELPSDIQALVERVNSIDHDMARLSLSPDKKLAGRGIVKLNPGQQILKRIKGIFGIDRAVGNRKREKKWRRFTNDRQKANRSR